ncbi:MAG: hypothetical protein AAF449_10810, partial [Myxococcota bacterium]
KANEALKKLSQDPEAQRLARWREDQMFLYQVEMTEAKKNAKEEGQKEGRREGQKEGRREGLTATRQSAFDICEVLGVHLTDEQRAFIDQASLEELKDLRSALKQLRRWPS